ncbi:accessory gene regulator ArgB-like protein [Cohnella sp. GCM10027633]|uniref:accessory gene regulator ArgB-like protein n=1 Tax=unclassified Cohnella TaxID=2636738 RepID=UPI0036316500
MIEGVAHRLATKIKEANPEETASIDVMKFALFGLLNNLIITIVSLSLSFLFGQVQETIIVITSFSVLRLFSGGFHFKTPRACFIFTTLIFILTPFAHLSGTGILVASVLALSLVLIFAPSNIKEHIQVDEKYFPLFKFISTIIVIASYFINDSAVTMAILAQSITLINLNRRGGDFNEEK